MSRPTSTQASRRNLADFFPTSFLTAGGETGAWRMNEMAKAFPEKEILCHGIVCT
jgi:hypothetical protein